MVKIKLLDLCCGAGGCSMGYKLAADELGIGIEIVGVDVKEQKNYPFTFVRDDAMSFLQREYARFTHIHASPPCQEYTHNSNAKRKAKVEGSKSILPDLRVKMYETMLPGVIENVMGAPLIPDIILEGRMFGLKVIRRRMFETVNWFSMKPGVPVYRRGMVARGECMTVVGHGSYKNSQGNYWQVEGDSVLSKRRNAMGIDWMTDREITQAIPPAYTKYIGLQFLKIQGGKRS
jgi:DNA (cytosine-5)-methyltransferase 1